MLIPIYTSLPPQADLLQNAREQFARADFSFAEESLQQSLQGGTLPPHLQAAALHNLGCAQAVLGRPHTAALSLSRALAAAEASISSASLHGVPPGKLHPAASLEALSYATLYLAGVQHLRLGRIDLAASCIAAALCSGALLRRQPTAWVRLAECAAASIGQHRNAAHHSGTLQPLAATPLVQLTVPEALQVGLGEEGSGERQIVEGLLMGKPLDLSLAAAQAYLQQAQRVMDGQQLHHGETPSLALRWQIQLLSAYLSLQEGDAAAALVASERVLQDSAGAQSVQDLLGTVGTPAQHGGTEGTDLGSDDGAAAAAKYVTESSASSHLSGQRTLAVIYAADALCILGRATEAVRQLIELKEGSVELSGTERRVLALKLEAATAACRTAANLDETVL